jgi:lauroyl/myristoyl acyltransferase
MSTTTSPSSADVVASLRTVAGRGLECVRRAIPQPLLPLVIGVRSWVAWARPSVRRDARRQMRFLLERGRPDADIDVHARRYVRRQVSRGELRWHPDLVTQQRVVGIESLLAARAHGRGVLVACMHHGQFDGAFPSIARLGGVTFHMTAFPSTLSDQAPGWIRQHVRVCKVGGNQPVSIEIGTPGITRLLQEGALVGLALDVPGRTRVRFAGRELVGSFGAARIAASTGAPVVAVTHEVDAQGPYLQVHEGLRAEDFESPHALLEELLRVFERAVLATPHEVDIPTSRWGVPQEAAG